MSQRAAGWAMTAAGLILLAVGSWIVCVGTFSVGAGFTVIGGFALGSGACLLATPWRDSVDQEIDRWERNWNSEWSPECPVHGSTLCYTRTRRCPGVRERVS